MFSKFDFLAHRKIWFTFSGVMVLIAIISVIMFRFNWGIDFTGGTILELGFDKDVTVEEVRNGLREDGLQTATIQLSGDYAGEAGNDVIMARGLDVWPDGSGFVNQLFGGAGNDYIEGGGGSDLIEGGAGYDVLYGLGGDDEIHGGAGNDYIDGGTGNDRLFGEAGRDNLIGGQGDDELHGGSGDDLLVGAQGSDLLDAAEGSDRVVSSGAGDTVNANASSSVQTLEPVRVPSNFSVNGDRLDRDRIASDLDALASLPHGQKMFGEIARTGHSVAIELTPDGSACASFAGNTRSGVGSDSQIFYNAGKIALSTDMPWANRAPIVSLYHEMCHSYNAAVGNMDKGWYQKDGTKMPNGEGTPGLEYQAVGIDVTGIEANDPLLTENGLRDLLGYQKREEY